MPVDVVFVHGVVRTMDDALPIAEAVAVDDGRIVFVGDEAGAEALIGEGTRVVDLRGDTLLPGFVDAHVHLVTSGAELLEAPLYDCEDVACLQDAARAYAAGHADGWVMGAGYDVATFEGRLTRQLLDEAVPDRPAYMSSVDGHTAWVNSAALAAAGITAKTKDPPGGVIDRDADGVPTGMIRENALDLLYAVMPEYDPADLDKGLITGQSEAHRVGVTSALDPDVGPDVTAAYRRAQAAGTLQIRVRAAWGATSVRDVKDAAEAARYAAVAVDVVDPGLFRVNSIKLFLDGVIESETAWLLQPYVDGTNGEALFADGKLRKMARVADRAGLQLHAHALGDGAVRQMLDTVQWLEATEGPRDRRPLLAHIELVDPADIPRFAQVGAYADAQALWAYPDPYIRDLTWPVIGPERSRWLYPFGSLAAAGATVVGGSDWSVTTIDPLDAIEVGVTRQDPDAPPDAPGDVLVEAERLTIDAMLRAYTITGARALFLEEEVGSITVGKRADLVILDHDPYEVDPHALSEIAVRATWFDGREVYAAPAR